MCVCGEKGGKDENVLGRLLVRTELQNGREGRSGGGVEGEWRGSGGGHADETCCVASFLCCMS